VKYVFMFSGPTDALPVGIEELQSSMPEVKLVRHTERVLSVELEDRQLDAARSSLPDGWTFHPVAYLDASPPPLDMAALESRLKDRKQ
jgi:hypothetical protein